VNPFALAQAGDRRPFVMASAHVIEVGDIAAGIVVLEQDGFRFFAADRPFYALEGAVFRTVDQATRAARERLQRKRGCEAASDRHGGRDRKTAVPRPDRGLAWSLAAC
jgi:hypothetical protein